MVQSRVLFAHGFRGSQLDPVGGMDEPIQDGIGNPAATEILMPVAYRELGRDHGGPAAVALLDGLEQVLFFSVTHGGQAKVVQLCGAPHNWTCTKPLRGSREFEPSLRSMMQCDFTHVGSC